MPTEILMPALSPTMEEGKLAKWLVREGDQVRAGDVIAEIETDKATMEVEAADDGRLGKILVPEGTEHVPVNRPIAILLADGEEQPQAAARPPPPGEDAAQRAAGEGARVTIESISPSPRPSRPRGRGSARSLHPISAKSRLWLRRRRRVHNARPPSRAPSPRFRPGPRWSA